jgi:rhodanese-related sulfurtransferase
MQEQKIQECFAIRDLQQQIRQSPELLIIIDVRNPEEYTEKHIPGAINIPLPELESRSKELSRHVIIVTVCGKGGGRSAQGADLLKQAGFNNANYLCGGTFGWYNESDPPMAKDAESY